MTTANYQPHTVLKAEDLDNSLNAKADLDTNTGKLLASELPGSVTSGIAANSTAAAQAETDAQTGITNAAAASAEAATAKSEADQALTLAQAAVAAEGVTVSDGTSTIAGAKTLTFSGGATVTGGSGNATIALPAGGSGAKSWPLGSMPAQAAFTDRPSDNGVTITNPDTSGVFVIRRLANNGTAVSVKDVPLTQGNNFRACARVSKAGSNDGSTHWGIGVFNSTSLQGIFLSFGGGNLYVVNYTLPGTINSISNGSSLGYFEPGFAFVDLAVDFDSQGLVQFYYSTDGLPLDNANKSWAKLYVALTNAASISADRFGVFLDANDMNTSRYSLGHEHQVSCASLVVNNR